MMFPVDVLAGVSQTELERLAQSYMTELLYSNPDSPERLTLPDSTEIEINVSTVGLVSLYGSCDTLKILALFAPADPFTPVALYLLGQWWMFSDILRTGDSKRDGAVQVETVAERIVLYVLNRVIYRAKEMSADELPFLCHGETDFAKILWRGGEAAGFYSVKPRGSMCCSFSSQSYPLPVMDSMYVRKCFRGKGLGLRMLEDYVESFREDCLGLRYPLTTAMYKVCECYLRELPGNSELLWEVDSSRLSQITTIASKIQTMNLRAVSKTLTYSDQSVQIHDRTTVDTLTEHNTTFEETQTIQQTMKTAEEVTIVRTSKEIPVSTRGRSNGSKHRTTGQKHTEEQLHSVVRISEKVILPQFKINSEVVRTEDLLNVATKNVPGLTVSEAKEEVLFQKVTCLKRSEEESVALGLVEDENTTHGLNTLCSTVVTVENVASEMEESLHTPEHVKEEQLTNQVPEDTAPLQGPGKMERVLRTTIFVNIPLPPAVNEDEPDMGKTVDKTEIPEEMKNKAKEKAKGHVETVEETPTVHRRTLRGRQSAPNQPTRVSKGHKKTDLKMTAEDTEKQEPALVQEEDTVDRLDGDVATETEYTVEETQPEDSTSAEAAEEKKREEEACTADVGLVSLHTSQSENTKHSESSVDMDKESQPEMIMEEKEADSSTEEEHEPAALPEEPAPSVKTRPLRSGPKTLKATSRCQRTTDRLDAQQETRDEPQDSLEAQSEAAVEVDPSKAIGRKETSSQVLLNEEASAEAIVNEKNLSESVDDDQPPSETKGPEEAPSETIATKEEPSEAMAPEDVEVSAGGVVKTRILRSEAKRVKRVSTPRTIISRKKKAEEETLETIAMKRDRNSTGRKQVSRTVKTTLEEGTSSAEEDTTDEPQAQSVTVYQAPIEGSEVPLPAAVEEDEAGMNEPVTDSETIVLTDTKAKEVEPAEDSAAKEDTQEEEPAPVLEEDTVDKAEGDVVAVTEDAVEETQPEDSKSAEAAEEDKREEEACTADVGLVFLNTSQSENTKHSESSVDMDNESHPEMIMEEKEADSGTEEEHKPDALPEEPEDSTSSVETRALRSGPKTLTLTEAAVEVDPSKAIARKETSSEVNEETPVETIAIETEPSEAMALSAEGFVETRVLRSGAKQFEGGFTPRTSISRRKETVETTAVKRGIKSAGRKQLYTPEEPSSQEERTTSAEKDATARPHTLPLMYDKAETDPDGEQTPAKYEVQPTDNVKQREAGHQAAIEGADLPRVAVLLVDFNKVHLVTQSPQSEQKESPYKGHIKEEALSPNETPALDVETRLRRSGGKPVAATAKRRLSQQQNEEECSTTEDTELEQHKVDHTEDQALEAEQAEGGGEGTCESQHSKETQSSEQRTNLEEVDKSGEEAQVAEETNASEMTKGAEKSEPDLTLTAGNQKYVEPQMQKKHQTEDSTEVENTESTKEEAEDALKEKELRVSSRVLRSGRKLAQQNADNRCTEDQEVPDTSPPKRARKSASATNRGRAKKACIEPQENNKNKPSSTKDTQTEEIKPKNTPEVVPEGSSAMGNTEKQEAAEEAEEPHAQVELEKSPEAIQIQEEILTSQEEPALHVDTDGGKHVAEKRQHSQQQAEEECSTTEDTNPEEEAQAQEMTHGLDSETPVTEGSAEQEASAEENEEREEADKAEDVLPENIQKQQPEEEEASAQTRTYRGQRPTPRRSSRTIARVDYRDNDEELDPPNASASEDFQESDKMTAPQPQTKEEEPSEGDVLKKILRGKSVPFILITPHSKSNHRRSKGHSPEGFSDKNPVQSPQSAPRRRIRKRRSAEVTPLHKSKRHRD